MIGKLGSFIEPEPWSTGGASLTKACRAKRRAKQMSEAKYKCTKCGRKISCCPTHMEDNCFGTQGPNRIPHDWQPIAEPEVQANERFEWVPPPHPNSKDFVPVKGFNYPYGQPTKPKDGVTLSLLIIDLGDSCVIKVEKGNPIEIFPALIVSAYEDSIAIINVPFSGFESVRKSVDKLAEGEKPVPRIEQNYPTDENGYTFIDQKGDNWTFNIPAYNSLSEIAGKPLPVWKPKRGAWTKIYGNYPVDDKMLVDPSAPCEIWRFQTIEEGE